MRKMFVALNRFALVLSNEASWKTPKPIHELILRISSELPFEIRDTLINHLDHIYFTEYTNPQICRFSVSKTITDAHSITKIYGNLICVSDDATGLSYCNITFYREYLFSLEFEQNWRSAIEKPLDKVRLKKGNDRVSISRQIDSSEHA